MSWTSATVALAVLAVAAVSRRLSGGPLTPAMAFVALGLLAGPGPARRPLGLPQLRTVAPADGMT